MKWGRRSKTGSRPNQSPSSPRPSLLSSWLLKFKKMGGNGAGDDESTVKDKPLKAVTPSRRRTQNSPSEEAEFYGGEDAYWRLSFRKGRMDRGYELEDGGVEADEEEEGEGEMKNFSEMVSGIRRRREMQRSTESLPELNLRRRVKEKELKTPRRPKMKGRNSRTSDIGEDPTFSPLGIGNLEGLSPELGSEERKSLYISRGSPKRRTKHTCRVRISTPRTSSKAEISRLRANKRANERKKGLERFAVVKCSFDPQSDFRDSMLEMILERRICQPEELEELLACYLTLNSDEYHDLIIKVFRQIWFELNQTSYDLTDDAEGLNFY